MRCSEGRGAGSAFLSRRVYSRPTSAPRFRPDALARVEDAALRPAGSWEQLTRILLVRYGGRGGGAPRTTTPCAGWNHSRCPAPPARPSRQRRSSHSGPGHPSPPDRKPRRGGSRSLQIISDGVFSQCSDPASTLSQQRQREGACSACSALCALHGALPGGLGPPRQPSEARYHPRPPANRLSKTEIEFLKILSKNRVLKAKMSRKAGHVWSRFYTCKKTKAEIHQPGAEPGAHAENPRPLGRGSQAGGAPTPSPVLIVNKITLQPGHSGPPVPGA